MNDVTGAAAVVAEAAAKPEITLVTTTLIATAAKIAAHMALTQESISDWDAFTSSATTELQQQVIDAENAEILGWLDVPGILTKDATVTAPDTALDIIETAIVKLRTGPSLAVADLLILHPDTWSSVRRTKDEYGRYMTQPDPTVGEADSVWGVSVLSTTSCPATEGWLLDTRKFGRLAVRESLTVRMGFANDDLIKNLVRYVAELREVLTVERPSAVLKITALPASLEAEEASSSKSSKSSSK